MKLNEMDFANIYLGKEVYITGPKLSQNPSVIDPNMAKGLKDLCTEKYDLTGKNEFMVEFEGVRFRASLIDTIKEKVFACRKMPDKVKLLTDLGIYDGYTDLFLQPGLTGLVVIAGEFGHGKTWTASGALAERLRNHGGVAVTLEDPIEMPLNGLHGQGVCYQTEVEKNQFGSAMHRAARWAPDIIYVSELRDSETVTEALRAAINGKLVISTMHADQPKSALERIFNFANGYAGGADDVSSLMSNAFSLVVHQKLSEEGDQVVPRLTPLSFIGEDATSVKSLVRERKWEQLISEINRQVNSHRINSRQGRS
ncbi:MAG: ATPase, T2SS/T4P/T4SS family [Hydrogenovibrio sp.]